MSAVYLLTLRQLSGRWRILVMMALAALPVTITLLMANSGRAPSVDDFEQIVLNGMLAGAIAPLVVLAIASVAFANEVEDRTLANLMLAPIPRWQIAVPKLLAAITVAAPFMVLCAIVTANLAYLGDARAMLAVAAAIFAGVALYAAMFVWLGLVTTQAIGFGLLYIVLWEGFIAGYVAGVRMLSIRYYTIGLMHGFDPRLFSDGELVGFNFAAVASIAAFAGFVALSVQRLRSMDIP